MSKKIIFSLSLLVFLTACNNSGRKEENGSTTPPKPTKTVEVKPTVNVYIENSGSMDGYVRGTEFKEAVFGYLSNIKISGISDTINLNYINSIIIPQVSVVESNSIMLEEFVKKLTPTSFKNGGGNRGKSDISDVIKSVLFTTKENEIAILVSDGIFSPGKGDAEEYLSIQKNGIKVSMANYLGKHPNTAVIVYQLLSNFNGTYYNKVDAKSVINEPRPYYIYVVGNTKCLSELRSKVPDRKFEGGGVKNIFIAVSGNKSVKYVIDRSVGKIKIPRADTTKSTIKNLGKDSRAKDPAKAVKFAVNVDFSGLLLDESYLLDTNNYENNSKYSLEIKPNITKNGYTHTLTFTSDKVTKGAVSIKLKAQMPDWVENANDYNGIAAVRDKTYGIKYQIDGIFSAFLNEKVEYYHYTEIKININ